MANVHAGFVETSTYSLTAASVYGQSIPITAGDRAIQGRPIWCGEFKQDPTTMLFKVDVAYAFGYHLQPDAEQHVLRLARLWMGAGFPLTLMYDASDSTKTLQSAGVADFTLHVGSATATPDPIILAALGTDAIAYRNMIYIVFKGWVMAQPNIFPLFAEFVNTEGTTNLETTFDGLGGATLNHFGEWVDWQAGVVYIPDGSGTAYNIHSFDIKSQTEIASVPLDAPSGGSSPTIDGLNHLNNKTGIDIENSLMFVNEEPSFNTCRIGCWNYATGQQTDTFGIRSSDLVPTNGASPGPPFTNVPNASLMVTVTTAEPGIVHRALVEVSQIFGWMALIDYTKAGVMNHTLTARGVLDLTAAGYFSFSTSTITQFTAFNFVSPTGYNPANFGAGLINSSQDTICALAIDAKLLLVWIGFRNGAMTVLGISVLRDWGSGSVEAFIICRDQSIVAFHKSGSNWTATRFQAELTQSLVTTISGGGGFTEIETQGTAVPFGYVGIFPSFGDINTTGYKDKAIAAVGSAGLNTACTWSDISLGNFGYASGGGYELLNLATGENYASGHFSNEVFPFAPTGDYVWDCKQSGFLSNADPTLGGSPDSPELHLEQVDQFSADSLEIGDVCRWIALKAGYAADHIDVDPALTDGVRGVIIDKPYDLGKLFGDLGTFYNFTAFESGGHIKFVRALTGDGVDPPDLTLTTNDLAAISEGNANANECLITTLALPASIPNSVVVDYIDPNHSFLFSSQQFNVDTGVSGGTATAIDTYVLPIVMTAAQAYAGASKITVRETQSAATQQLRLPQRFSRVEPSDLATVQINGFSYVVKFDDVTFNADWSLSLNAKNYSFNDSVQQLPPDDSLGGSTVAPSTIAGFSDSLPLVFDTPLLNPDNDSGATNAFIYTGAASFGQDGWQSAKIQYSLDGVAFVTLYNALSQLKYGITVGAALPDTATPEIVDEVNTITVACSTLAATDFLSTDAAGLLGGKNSALVGAANRWEFIFFRDVTVISPKKVTLSGILRGQRGTDYATGMHGRAEKFVLVDSVATGWAGFNSQFSLLPVTYLDDDLVWRASGKTAKNALRVELDTFEANSLRPFTVANPTAVFSSTDIVLTWLRRDRLANDAWVTSPVEMSEATEKYDLEILSGPGGSVKRTALALTSPTYTYTLANQTTDTWTAGAGTTITVRIYQLSAAVGRGFFRELTLDIG